MSVSQNVQSVRNIIEAVNRFDIDYVTGLATEDIVIDQPFAAMGFPERQQGHESFVEAMNGIPAMFSSFNLEISQVYDVPGQDIVIFEMESKAVFAINGASYANRYIMVFGFRDGKLCLWREYYNPLLLEEQMAPIMALMAE